MIYKPLKLDIWLYFNVLQNSINLKLYSLGENINTYKILQNIYIKNMERKRLGWNGRE